MNKPVFNLRVYGLMIQPNGKVLLSDEEEQGKQFTKFPGGGLEYGEGLIEGLKREFIEECKLKIEVEQHFYTTDFFVESVFGGGQLISVYYLVKPMEEMSFDTSEISFDFKNQISEPKQSFRWVNIQDLHSKSVTFPVDQYVVNLLKTKYL